MLSYNPPLDMPPDFVHDQCFPGESLGHMSDPLKVTPRLGRVYPHWYVSLTSWGQNTLSPPQQYSITTRQMSWSMARLSPLVFGIPPVRRITTVFGRSRTRRRMSSSSASRSSARPVSRTCGPRCVQSTGLCPWPDTDATAPAVMVSSGTPRSHTTLRQRP